LSWRCGSHDFFDQGSVAAGGALIKVWIEVDHRDKPGPVGYAQGMEQDGSAPPGWLRTCARPTAGMVFFFSGRGPCLGFLHVGRRSTTISNGKNLDIWASQPMPFYFVMPPDCAAAWPDSSATRSVGEIERWSRRLAAAAMVLPKPGAQS